MRDFVPLAEPWWVNLFIGIPFLALSIWRKSRPALSLGTLAAGAAFGAAFGYVEAAVVVYLRAAVGLLPGYGGSLADVARLSSQVFQQSQILTDLPLSLMTVELFRETATIVMLVTLALLSAKRWRERSAIFLWSFAMWDLCYYLGLYLTVGWPPSLLTPDVLFLIPEPWLAQVWFPMLVSALTLLAVIAGRKPVAVE